jgi:hypothetical protein
MFTFESMVEAYTKGAKQLNSFVPQADVRKNLDGLVDKQVEFATSMYDVGTKMAKSAQENLAKFNPLAK